MTPTRLFLLLSLAGAPALGAQQSPPVTQLRLAGPTIYVRLDTVSTSIAVPGSTLDVFRQTAATYKALKIKADLADSLTGQIGSTGFLNTGAFAGRRMSSWIRCGEGLTGPNADNWRVSIAILSAVERVNKDTTLLRTAVVASARDLAQGSSTAIRCATTGGMEEMINQKVLALATGRDSIKAEKKP